MTGSWLIVKWIVFAIFLLCAALSFVVAGRTWPKGAGRGAGILGLTAFLLGLPNLVRDFSHSVTALRISYVVAGTVAIGLIVVSSLMLFGRRGFAES